MSLTSFRWAAAAIVILAWAGCQNPVSWENDVHIPILDDRIDWGDLIPDSLVEPGVEGGPAHFVLIDTLDGWNIEEIVELPDSTIVTRFSGEDELNNPVPVVEDASVLSYSQPLSFDVDQLDGMELTEAKFLGGTLVLEVQHSLEGVVYLDYDFPSVMTPSGPLNVPMTLPAATPNVPGFQTVMVDLSESVIDFTGASGNETNTVLAAVSAVSGPINNGVGSYLIEASDSVVVTMRFQSLAVERVAGYFGQIWEDANGSLDLIDTVPVPNAAIELDGVTAALHFTNTIGADFELYIDTVEFDGEAVVGDLIGGHEIPRATWIDGVPTPYEWSLDLGAPTSNFLDLLEGIPQSLYASGRMALNPQGNGGLLLDRFDINYPPTFWYELRVPIVVGADGLVLRDTFELEGLDEFPEFDGYLHLDFSSTFPVQLTGELAFQRNDGVLYQDTVLIEAGSVPLNVVGQSTVSIPLSEEMLLPGGQVAVAAYVNTFGAQEFTGYEYVRLQGRLEGTQLIEIE